MSLTALGIVVAVNIELDACSQTARTNVAIFAAYFWVKISPQPIIACMESLIKWFKKSKTECYQDTYCFDYFKYLNELCHIQKIISLPEYQPIDRITLSL